MSEKQIVWVHSLGDTVASYRYRAQIPAAEVGKLNGYKTAINGGDADIVVFSKPVAGELEIAEKAKLGGAKIVVDFCDDHFQRDDTYLKFADIADGIVCASDIMRGRIYDYTKKHSATIPDPYEQAECEPHADGDVFIWFGNSVNLKDIANIAHLIKDRKLIVATGPTAPRGIQPIQGPHMLAQALAQANIALLPTREGAEYKSPNRLLNALRAGLFSVCMAHPAYKEFRRFAWVGSFPSGFPTGLRWVDSFKRDLNDCVKAGQDYIRERYSPATIGHKWASYLESL